MLIKIDETFVKAKDIDRIGPLVSRVVDRNYLARYYLLQTGTKINVAREQYPIDNIPEHTFVVQFNNGTKDVMVLREGYGTEEIKKIREDVITKWEHYDTYWGNR